MDVLLRLREATAEIHRALEALPFATALVEGTVSRPAYAAALGQLWHVHHALEAELAGHLLGAVLFRPAMARCPALERDLAALGGAIPAVPDWAARQLADRIRALGSASGWYLVGGLYVSEGSRMGSLYLLKPLARALAVPVAPGRGLDYHLDAAADRPAAWQEFRAALRSLALEPHDRDRLVEGAVATMKGLYDVYAALPTVTADVPVICGVGAET
jgi:heme oxygenase